MHLISVIAAHRYSNMYQCNKEVVKWMDQYPSDVG
jgi:hypothetical protein